MACFTLQHRAHLARAPGCLSISIGRRITWLVRDIGLRPTTVKLELPDDSHQSHGIARAWRQKQSGEACTSPPIRGRVSVLQRASPGFKQMGEN
jgi:hypothetical protein